MSEDIKLTDNAQKVLDLIASMTILEAADLVKAMEDKFGVQRRRPRGHGRHAAAAAGEAEEVKDGVHRHADRRRRQEDPGHQGRPRASPAWV